MIEAQSPYSPFAGVRYLYKIITDVSVRPQQELPCLECLTRDQAMVICLQHMTALSPNTVMVRHYDTCIQV